MYTNRQIWNVSYPIFLSLLAQNVINVTDTAFLGRVGEIELGASAMGGLYYICAFTIAFGFSTGSQIIMARRNGERNYKEVGPVMIQGVFFLLMLAAVMFTLSRLFAGDIMRVLISSDTILNATEEFLDWRVFGFFFSFVNVMFRALFIGITRTKVLTLNAVVMALTNVLLDYLLIFGNCGFPELGIKGAAIASVMAEAVSIVFYMVYTRMTVDIKKYALSQFRRHGAHPRRNGRRQGRGGPPHPRTQPAQGKDVPQGGLRRHFRKPHRVGTLRLHAGSLHRRGQQGQERLFRNGRRRHGVSRRNRRTEPCHADPFAPRASGWRDHARGLLQAPQGQRPHHRRHEPQPC